MKLPFASFITFTTFRVSLPALLLGLSLVASVAEAGFVEIGASGSYRRSVIDSDAFDESQSITGTLAYYFNEASAIELSYTDSQNKRSISADKPNGHVTNIFQNLIGLDFMYTAGKRDSSFRPYAKAGAMWIVEKRIVDQYRGLDGTLFEPSIVEGKKGVVPSAGLGFKIALTENLSLKAGVDAWTSQPTSEEPLTIDYAARAGLSLLF